MYDVSATSKNIAGGPMSIISIFRNHVIKDHLSVFALGITIALAGTASLAHKEDDKAAHCEYHRRSEVLGLSKVSSNFNVDETTARLEAEITGRGLNVIAVIDHAANAANVGKELRPTKLVIFGNPNIGSDLMASEQTIGIDLPQKYLVWEAEDGSIYIGYNRAEYLQCRHKITDREDIFNTVAGALDVIANTAAGNVN